MAALSQAVVQEPVRRPARLRSLILPREHGAWGMLLVPLFTGAAVGLMTQQRWWPLLLFTIASLALFWMRTPAESWLGSTPLRAQTTAERQAVAAASLILGGLAAVCLLALLWPGGRNALLALGAVAAASFVAQILLRRLGRHTRMLAQVVGCIGLTSTAPGAYYAITGHLDHRAAALWLANWLFAGNQVHFVQLRIHAARAQTLHEKISRGRAFLVGQVLMAIVLVLAWRLARLPGLALIAFLPVTVRGAAWFLRGPRPLQVHRLGWSELRQAVVFAMLLVIAFALA